MNSIINIVLPISNDFIHYHREGYFHLIEHLIISKLKKKLLKYDRNFFINGYTVFDHISIDIEILNDTFLLDNILYEVKSVFLEKFSTQLDLHVEKNCILDEIKKNNVNNSIEFNKSIFLEEGIDFLPIGNINIKNINLDDINFLFDKINKEYCIISFSEDNNKVSHMTRDISKKIIIREEKKLSRIYKVDFLNKNYLIIPYRKYITSIEQFIFENVFENIILKILQKKGIEVYCMTLKSLFDYRYSIIEMECISDSFFECLKKDISGINRRKIKHETFCFKEKIDGILDDYCLSIGAKISINRNNMLYDYPFLLDRNVIREISLLIGAEDNIDNILCFIMEEIKNMI